MEANPGGGACSLSRTCGAWVMCPVGHRAAAMQAAVAAARARTRPWQAAGATTGAAAATAAAAVGLARHASAHGLQPASATQSTMRSAPANASRNPDAAAPQRGWERPYVSGKASPRAQSSTVSVAAFRA
eukprot:272854-Chlamydomonas_euryale.AAC.4